MRVTLEQEDYPTRVSCSRTYNRSVDQRERRHNQSDVQVQTIDELAVMSDDELTSGYVDLNRQRIDALRERRQTYSFDIELAYYQRESQIRSERRREHRKYVEEVEADFSRQRAEEESLPEFMPNHWLVMRDYN